MTPVGRRIPPLYPITDRVLSGGKSHARLVRELVAGGATWIQVRDKEASDRDLAREVEACVRVAGARILVNDRPDIARVTGAAGVHLGDRDLPVEEARALLGTGAIIGLSTHSVEEAIEACRRPVDYVALGPVFDTSRASVQRGALGPGAVREAAARMTRPLVAIGGIGLDSAGGLLRSGAASVAVISDLMRSGDPGSRVAGYLSLGGGPERIFLVGFMGAGKTTAGEAAAGLLGLRFLDLDREIEREAGKTIPGIFKEMGEAGFRRLESEALRRAAAMEGLVVACGGGILTVPENRELIARSGRSLWLRAPLRTMLDRCAGVEGGGRPLLGEAGEMERLLESRLEGYRGADMEIEAGSGAPGEVALRIAASLGRMG